MDKRFYLMRKNDIVTFLLLDEQGGIAKYSPVDENLDIAPLQYRYQPTWIRDWWNDRSVPIGQGKIKAYLEKRGFEVTYLDVDEDGLVNIDELEAEIRPDTILISVMAANNEIGTIEPLKRIGKVAHKHGVLFHTDAVQAYAHIPLQVEEMNIDMLSASGHKINGPKGIGFLYIRKGVKIRSFIHGGAQERKRRAGTHNVPGIVGFGKAAELAYEHLDENIEKLLPYRHYTINVSSIGNAIFNNVNEKYACQMMEKNSSYAC